MINVNQLRNGTAFEENGEPFLVIKYEFTKMGRGTGNVKVKVRNLKTGAVITKTYTTGNKVQDIRLTRKKMQYLYSDESKSVFMDPDSFEQTELDINLVEKQKRFFVDGMEVQVLFWDPPNGGEAVALSVELPQKISLKVKTTEPGAKGNSATNVFKLAILENGMEIKVPLFIVEGEKVVIKTDTGEYVERGR